MAGTTSSLHHRPHHYFLSHVLPTYRWQLAVWPEFTLAQGRSQVSCQPVTGTIGVVCMWHCQRPYYVTRRKVADRVGETRDRVESGVKGHGSMAYQSERPVVKGMLSWVFPTLKPSAHPGWWRGAITVYTGIWKGSTCDIFFLRVLGDTQGHWTGLRTQALTLNTFVAHAAFLTPTHGQGNNPYRDFLRRQI